MDNVNGTENMSSSTSGAHSSPTGISITVVVATLLTLWVFYKLVKAVSFTSEVRLVLQLAHNYN